MQAVRPVSQIPADESVTKVTPATRRKRREPFADAKAGRGIPQDQPPNAPWRCRTAGHGPNLALDDDAPDLPLPAALRKNVTVARAFASKC